MRDTCWRIWCLLPCGAASLGSIITGSRQGREVDFLVQGENRTRMLVHVCESLVSPPTRARELQAIEEAMTELKNREGVIVTRWESESIQVKGGTVRVVPAWRFLLDLEIW